LLAKTEGNAEAVGASESGHATRGQSAQTAWVKPRKPTSRSGRRGIRGGAGGAVTAIQRFGSALNTNVHFHTLVAQGVFFEKADGTVGFAPAPAPSDIEAERLLQSIRRRTVRLVARHGIA
jgi:putative transposase